MARACQGRLKLPARESLRVERVPDEEEELDREEEVELARLCDCDDEEDDDDDDEVEDKDEDVIVVVVVVVVVRPDRLVGHFLDFFSSSSCTGRAKKKYLQGRFYSINTVHKPAK